MSQQQRAGSRKSRRAKIYLVVDRWIARGIAAVEALHRGFWLGLMDRTALNEATAAFYNSAHAYHQPDYNLSGLVKWEDAVIEKFFKECRSILVGASGGGREVLDLCRQGFEVDAFDPSPIYARHCADLLASEMLRGKAVQSEPDVVPESLGIYDGLIMGWGGYTHVPGRAARIRLLKQFRGHVHDGGPILISFWTRTSGDERQLRWIHAIADRLRRIRLRSESVEFGDSLHPSFVHSFSQHEIQSELAEGGFRTVFYSEKPYGHAVGIAEETTFDRHS